MLNKLIVGVDGKVRKSLLILFIGVLVLGSSLTPAFAEDKVENRLTLQTALDLAHKNSLSIKNISSDIERSEEVRNKAAENFFFMPTGPGNGLSDALLVRTAIGVSQADLAWNMNKKQLGVAEDRLAYNVLKSYQEVLKKQQEQQVAKLSLKKVQNKEKIANLRFLQGMTSQFEQKQAEYNLKEEKEKLDGANKALNDARQKLNYLLGVSSDKIYQLTDEPKLVELDLDEKGLDVHINRITSDSVVSWLADQNVRIAEMNLDLYVYNDPTNPNTYRAVEIDLDKARNNAADAKRQLGESVRSLYYTIKQLENQYDLLAINLTKAEDALKLTNVRFELGMATAMELLEAESGVAQLKNSLYALSAQHEQLKTAFAMPWVLGN
jgi:hypothetical protein